MKAENYDKNGREQSDVNAEYRIEQEACGNYSVRYRDYCDIFQSIEEARNLVEQEVERWKRGQQFRHIFSVIDINGTTYGHDMTLDQAESKLDSIYESIKEENGKEHVDKLKLEILCSEED